MHDIRGDAIPSVGQVEGLRFFLSIANGRLRAPISFPGQGTVSRFPTHPVVTLDPVNALNMWPSASRKKTVFDSFAVDFDMIAQVMGFSHSSISPWSST